MAVIDGFQAGDYVQARLHGSGADGADQWLVTEFTVTAVDSDGTVHGSAMYPAGINPTGDGWTVELISRTLTMPATLTEVDAVRYDDATVRLFGKGDRWTDEATGEPVRISDYKAFTLVT